jgi:hypothetical protein
MDKPQIHPGSQAMAGGSHGYLARAYFRVKPFMPRSFRWILRRFRTPGILRHNAGIWPIDETAADRPENWQGWPDGKQFALVFTHDVESDAGVANMKNLAEMEIRHGFRSSFNLIPEGSYEDPIQLREWMGKHGFEIGVHDLNHDGRLYASRESFAEKAKSINGWLAKWNAVGFRSGFMLRQLDWLHDLNLLYDTSTFDTDPFEPQPEGSHTIFPFHVKPPRNVSGPGYIELSYTLAQDSTLFLLLREKTPEIWKRKLDWIARNGGLALVNIHPDYVDFQGKGEEASTYPASILQEFLEYIRSEYDGCYWNPLARELALWYKNLPVAGQSPNC